MAGFMNSACYLIRLHLTTTKIDPRSVPIVGIQGITTRVAGSADEYLDWAVPSYTKLYNLTTDEHYLDVARVLLHDTKPMSPCRDGNLT